MINRRTSVGRSIPERCNKGHEFNEDTLRVDNKGALRCRICVNQYSKHYTKNNPDYHQRQKISAKNRARVTRKTEEGRLAAKESVRKCNYGLTNKEYNEILKTQNNSCAICQTKPHINGRDLAIDHDRKCCPGRKSCGKCVRGILCSSCNTSLGGFRDSTELLVSAFHYLIKHKASSPQDTAAS